MTFLFFAVGAVVAYFTWKYLSKGRIEKGHDRFSSHLIGGIAGFIAWTIIIAIGVPKSEVAPIVDEVKPIEVVATSGDTYMQDNKLTEQVVKSISPKIKSASVYMQYAGEHKGLNNLDISFNSGQIWGGAQDWNGVAITVFSMSKKLLLRSDIGKITFLVSSDGGEQWATVEVSKAMLPSNWKDLTYLEFFSHTHPTSGSVEAEQWLSEFYSKYSSAAPAR